MSVSIAPRFGGAFLSVSTITVAALAVVLGTAGPAAAVVATFVGDDHPSGQLACGKPSAGAPCFDYGLRIDDLGRIFTFGEGGVTLDYDDALGAESAVISGEINASLAGQSKQSPAQIGAEWQLYYTMTGVQSDGADGFTATGGTGFIWNASEGYAFQGLRDDNGAGPAVVFASDGHRVANDSTSFVFRGWIEELVFGQGGAGDACSELARTAMAKGTTLEANFVCLNDGANRRKPNDFLFTAELLQRPPGDAVVPLPASLWLLMGGLGGLAFLRRRAA